MKKDKRYLVKRKDGNSIKEWLCIEVVETAFKIRQLINNDEGYSTLFSSKVGDEFWLLKTDISTTGEAKYKILEEISEETQTA